MKVQAIHEMNTCLKLEAFVVTVSVMPIGLISVLQGSVVLRQLSPTKLQWGSETGCGVNRFGIDDSSLFKLQPSDVVNRSFILIGFND